MRPIESVMVKNYDNVIRKHGFPNIHLYNGNGSFKHDLKYNPKILPGYLFAIFLE